MYGPIFTWGNVDCPAAFRAETIGGDSMAATGNPAVFCEWRFRVVQDERTRGATSRFALLEREWRRLALADVASGIVHYSPGLACSACCMHRYTHLINQKHHTRHQAQAVLLYYLFLKCSRN